MKFKYLLICITTIIIIGGCNGQENFSKNENQKSFVYPVDDYGNLFIDVQINRIFNDSKKFPDCGPLLSTDSILTLYNTCKQESDFNLHQFVSQYFDTITKLDIHYKTDLSLKIDEHIENLWPILTRKEQEQEYTSLISLPYPYIVPGGRFNEIYYWDSYFTMLGLEVSKNDNLIKNMVKNFTYLIESFGHIPNGNRTYYLSRSQPPFYSLMVNMVIKNECMDSIVNYLPALEAEYTFWMRGKKLLSKKNPSELRVVLLDDSTILNRYWDNKCTPRPESYLEDIEIYKKSGRDTNIFRDIRAAAESGWDFSSRWLNDYKNLETIITTNIIPVDLNCLLYNLELTISDGYKQLKDSIKANMYYKLATNRKNCIMKYLWNSNYNYFFDYNFKTCHSTEIYSIAGIYPLFFRITDSLQAHHLAKMIKTHFLKDGGLVSTLSYDYTGHQWDYPNGWAPLQWIAYIGLLNYEYNDLATDIAIRWMKLNEKIFYGDVDSSKKGKMLEKYNVDESSEGKGGEYQLQDGFGWTNGVYMKFWSIYNNADSK